MWCEKMERNIENKFHAKLGKCIESPIANWSLTWSLPYNCCVKQIEYMKYFIIFDYSNTLPNQKFSYLNFPRKPPLQTLIFFMMNLISGFNQTEFNNFQSPFGLDFYKHFVTKLAMSISRLEFRYDKQQTFQTKKISC
jgi:hypothetical protein